MNSLRIFLLTVLLITSAAMFFPNVQAQSTRIVEVRHPTHVLAGGLEPFTVQAVVSFQDAPTSSSLAVGVVSIDSRLQVIVPGIVTVASPERCVNPPSLQALCVMRLHSPSGTENLEFRIGGLLGAQPPSVGTWDLNLTAGLLNSTDSLIAKSVSSVPFGVDLVPVTLTVNVPGQVKVAIDGAEQPPGPVTIGVALGTHNVSVTPIANIGNYTRIRFDRWSDGVTESNRTVTVQSASAYEYEALYVTQYLLSIESEQGTASGQGWYDANSTAAFSVNDVEPMNGLLGLLDGKLIFQGWFENQSTLTTSSSGIIVMNQAHALTAKWQADYSMPITIIIAVVIVIALVLALAFRSKFKRHESTRRSRPRGPGSVVKRSKPTSRRTRRSS